MNTPEEVVASIQEALQERAGHELIVVCGVEQDVSDMKRRLEGYGVGVEYAEVPCRFAVGLVYTEDDKVKLGDASIVVISSVVKHVQQARDSAVRYGLGPSDITRPMTDEDKVFFMIPANKNFEGGAAFALTAELRHRFIDWLENEETTCEWFELEEPKLVQYREV